MRAKTRFRVTGESGDSYLELVRTFPLASIKSDEHLNPLLIAPGSSPLQRLDEGEETYLDALSDLVAMYEDQHHAIEPASDADMLRHFLEARDVSQAQLSRDTAIPKSTISEVLAEKKPFSRQMIRKLSNYFKVDVGILAANF